VFERRGWRHTTGADDLKMMAVSRLLLDNIANVKAYWIMMGMPLAAVACGSCARQAGFPCSATRCTTSSAAGTTDDVTDSAHLVTHACAFQR
jgi:2-iminoacetate synthase ThiH